MANQTRKGGKKGRKIGRGKRKPAHMRYVAEKRTEENKLRRQIKIQKELARKQKRKALLEERELYNAVHI